MVGELICVRRTATVEEADIVVAWLDSQGLKAQVVDRENIGVRAFGVTDHEGIAVCVADEETAFKLTDHPVKITGVGTGTDMMRMADRQARAPADGERRL